MEDDGDDAPRPTRALPGAVAPSDNGGAATLVKTATIRSAEQRREPSAHTVRLGRGQLHA